MSLPSSPDLVTPNNFRAQLSSIALATSPHHACQIWKDAIRGDRIVHIFNALDGAHIASTTKADPALDAWLAKMPDSSN